MSKQELRNRSGNLIGKIHEKNGGKLEIRDRNSSYKGYYNPNTNKTYDKHNS
jgi:hypothetical protein